MTGKQHAWARIWAPGFALLEVMITLTIMLFGILLISRGEMQLNQLVQGATQREQVRALAQSQWELLHACAMGHGREPVSGECAATLAVGEHRIADSSFVLSWHVADQGELNALGVRLKRVEVLARWHGLGQPQLNVTLHGAVMPSPSHAEE